MSSRIGINAQTCIRCGRCVKVCPAQIFSQKRPGGDVYPEKEENCIHCGHCVCACPTASVCHCDFPAEKVHAADYAALPTPEQVMQLLTVRRSNRALSQKPVPAEMLELIVQAADRAPTATNARNLGYTLVTDPAALNRVSEYTLSVFGKVLKKVTNPLVKPWLRYILPDVYRYVPAFKRMRRDYEEGTDRILRGATALLIIHAPKGSRWGDIDANLAYQNASLMAESLGVSQIYMGFVLSAVHQDRNPTLVKMLHLEGRTICAVMALGMPQFRYPNYIDREKTEVVKI